MCGPNEADRELVYNDELTARKWALNSAVECHLHTSSRFNTFNNLTRLTATAKYLIVLTRQNLSGCEMQVQLGAGLISCFAGIAPLE
jgi:hypothetical protein